MRLDQSYEGRDEFFDAIWDRINELLRNPHLISDILLRNMQAFGQEGLVYLETQQGVEGAVKPDGSPYSMEEVVTLYRQLLASPQAKATGVEVRKEEMDIVSDPRTVSGDFVGIASSTVNGHRNIQALFGELAPSLDLLDDRPFEGVVDIRDVVLHPLHLGSVSDHRVETLPVDLGPKTILFRPRHCDRFAPYSCGKGPVLRADRYEAFAGDIAAQHEDVCVVHLGCSKEFPEAPV